MRITPQLRAQASRVLRAGGHDPKNGHYLGGWGDFGSPTQKGITTYAVSANRQRPLAGTLNAAVFNVARRTRNQILYWLPPFVAGYLIIQWAENKNEYLNSKPGRLEALENEGGDDG